MPGPVSTWMGDCLQMGKPSWYVTSHPGQLSLAIPPWVGAVSTSESWGVNRHTVRYTSPVSVVSQCKLVSGWGLTKRRSVPPYGPCGSGRTLLFCIHSTQCVESVPGVSVTDFSVLAVMLLVMLLLINDNDSNKITIRTMFMWVFT